MAFLPELYHPKWSLIRRMIKRRAGGRCEACGVEAGCYIVRTAPFSWRYATEDEVRRLYELTKHWDRRRKRVWGRRRALKYLKLTYVHLQVAHLDRDRQNNRFWNLKALCPAHHLLYDYPQHLRSRRYGREHTNVQLTIPFQEADSPPAP